MSRSGMCTRDQALKEKLEGSVHQVGRWVEARDYKGYEPFDGLTSALRPLTFGNTFAERLLQQLVRQSPVNLRPLLRVLPKDSTKGRGYMAWGYLIMYERTREEEFLRKARACLDWLDENKAPGHTHHAWGNQFDYASRAGKLPKDEPIIVWSSLIGQAFLEAHRLCEEPRYLDVARSICQWILELPREVTDRGTCLSYYKFEQCSVHNANMLGAAMLARTSAVTGEEELRKVAREAMVYACSRQRPDGSWYYGESPNRHWVDNFHTGYNLDSLRHYLDATGDSEFEENFQKGFEYFKKTFFEPSGRPKYYHNRVYPVDIQCAAQAIDSLAFLSAGDEETLELATRVASWTIDNMQDRAGHFYYRQYPLMKAKAPMLHWGQATMYKALALLLHKIDTSR